MYTNDNRQQTWNNKRNIILKKMTEFGEIINNNENKLHEISVDIVQEYGIINIVKPKSELFFDMGAYCMNKNVVLLVIEPMCVGIIMPVHIAMKFKYIENAIKYEDFKQVGDNGMKIVSIDEKWDTRRWSYSKIKNFYNWLSDIELKSCNEIEEEYKANISRVSFMRPTYDMHFLSSLCWNNDIDIENIVETSTTIVM